MTIAKRFAGLLLAIASFGVFAMCIPVGLQMHQGAGFDLGAAVQLASLLGCVTSLAFAFIVSVQS